MSGRFATNLARDLQLHKRVNKALDSTFRPAYGRSITMMGCTLTTSSVISMHAPRIIAYTALGLVLVAAALGCRTLSPPNGSLSGIWQRWQPIQPAEKLDDHDWLVGAWHCKGRELSPNSSVGPPNDYVYMEVTRGWGHAEFNELSALTFKAMFLMPDSQGWFGKRTWFTAFGYFDGLYTIGHPAQCDAFYMRRNPRDSTNEFILKHEKSEDYLLFERIPPKQWDELWDLWKSQEERAWTYLGIPANEEYPDTKFPLDKSVPPGKYWRVSKVRHVSREEFERDVTSGRAMFRNERSDAHYYAIELRGDFLRIGDTRYWVTILERKVYP